MSESKKSDASPSSKKTPVKKVVKVKKRPGRPRKTPLRKPRPRIGIIKEPKDPSNFVEFSYDKPMVFKKLWHYFKLMAVNRIQIIFRKNEMVIWGKDHHEKSSMRAVIHGAKVNQYYCSEELNLGLLCKNPKLIMSTIDKTYTTILWLSKVGYTQKDLRIILNNEIEIDESHKVELIGEYDKMGDESAYDNTDYTIKFKLPGRYFKKTMSDIRTFSDQLIIRQDGPTDPLLFGYVKQDKKIKSFHIVQNNDNIDFVSKLKEDDTFRVSFKIDYVRPISDALLAENVYIHAHENKPLMICASMDDGTVDITILTEIIDERNSNNTHIL